MSTSPTPTPTATLSDVCTVVYDHLEQLAPAWKTNNTTAVNPIPFDYLPQPTLVGPSGNMPGSMLFMASYSQNLAGGLISYDISFPPKGCTRNFWYAAFNVKQWIPPYPSGTFRRNELDLKWTIGAANTPNQANGSTEINLDTGEWRGDPTGNAWLGTGYFPKTFVLGQNNVFQIRLSTDGATIWSLTGLQCNDEAPYTPGAAFQNIPLITTNWTKGLHPQLQWEGGNAPFAATVYYPRVQVITSDAPIPMMINTTQF